MHDVLRLTRLSLHREFHISREARRRYAIREALFSIRGSLLVGDLEVAQQLATAINEGRDARRFPELAVSAGELYAAGLLDEILHLLLQVYREQRNPNLNADAYAFTANALGGDEPEPTLLAFADRFPTIDVERGRLEVGAYLGGATEGEPNRHIVLEEVLLLWLANANPALERVLELFDDRPLEQDTAYPQVIEEVRRFLAGQPGLLGGEESLFDMLRAPALASPTSLEGQLQFLRERWGVLLGDRFSGLLDRMLRSLDLLKEENKPQFGGPGPSVVLDARSLAGPGRERVEYERFSPDSSWMPRVVMLAKSSYVWLDQLSKRFGRDIHRLDQVPDEVLDELAERGFTGLWLIGLWERSEASRRIKHLRGQQDAVASAYALYDYQIAADLGGEAAYTDLRDRAWQRGVRLASDMVPNHVGIDGRWVIEHPDWFLQLDHPPFPGYTFGGPDLSSDERVGIFIEDHYYDSSDAAVVFKRLDRHSGEASYIYHGNDGTSFPWNDTAQLNYLNADAREAIIQTILHVARMFPIIRFDAAMTLAKQHVQRLWFPEPGHGGAIPSRTQYGSMSAEQLDELMPEEFWREVVDRVAQEVPDTLLLAEAFWMMEGYFVRTLGMHRVYNSAFMNMLKDEENAKYRQSIKNVLAFDPQILKRFVNFMNNPDEEPAVEQFGRDDKYFGVAVLMSTMPGLPMFGHGQVEGFAEKYGMEYRRAKLDESIDEWLVDRHRREVFPLLHRRAQFAEVDNFLLYDLVGEGGGVDENVFAYSNRVGESASLVVYNNRFSTARGWLRWSAPYAEKGRGDPVSRPLHQGLGVESGGFVILREHMAGVETLHRSDDLVEQGLYVELDAFKYRVYLDIRQVADRPGAPYAQLYQELSGRPVASVEDALRDLVLRPLHGRFAELVGSPLDDADGLATAFAATVEELEELGYRASPESRVRFRQSAATLVGLGTRAPTSLAGEVAELSELLLAFAALRAFRDPEVDAFRLPAVFLSGSVLDEPAPHAELWTDVVPHLLALAPFVAGEPVGAVEAPGADDAEPDASALDDGVAPAGARPDGAERATDGAALGEVPEASVVNAALLERASVRAFLTVNVHDGVEWFGREAYTLLRRGLVAAATLLRAEAQLPLDGLVALARDLEARQERSRYRVDLLLKPSSDEDEGEDEGLVEGEDPAAGEDAGDDPAGEEASAKVPEAGSS